METRFRLKTPVKAPLLPSEARPVRSPATAPNVILASHLFHLKGAGPRFSARKHGFYWVPTKLNAGANEVSRVYLVYEKKGFAPKVHSDHKVEGLTIKSLLKGPPFSYMLSAS